MRSRGGSTCGDRLSRSRPPPAPESQDTRCHPRLDLRYDAMQRPQLKWLGKDSIPPNHRLRSVEHVGAGILRGSRDTLLPLTLEFPMRYDTFHLFSP